MQLSSSHVNILAQGVKGDGCFSWVCISTSFGPLNIGSIYGPHNISHRTTMWEWIENLASESHSPWIFCGDFNMTNLPDDSTSPTKFITTNEARLWKCLIDQYDLIDLLFCATHQNGPYFTCQMHVGPRLNQSWLDCFCLKLGGMVLTCQENYTWCLANALWSLSGPPSLGSHWHSLRLTP